MSSSCDWVGWLASRSSSGAGPVAFQAASFIAGSCASRSASS
jgi:hypothetical protein